jgi:hypothetical protein
MTPAEQIAYLRSTTRDPGNVAHTDAIDAVCDLAERALLDDDEAEAVQDIPDYLEREYPVIVAVLRRLLGETP